MLPGFLILSAERATPVCSGGHFKHVPMSTKRAIVNDLTQAAVALGRPPEHLKEPLPDATLSTLRRLHGRLTYARGDQSPAIALHTRPLNVAEPARDPHAIERRLSQDGVFEGVVVARIDFGDDRALVFDERGLALEEGEVELTFRGEARTVHVEQGSGHATIHDAAGVRRSDDRRSADVPAE